MTVLQHHLLPQSIARVGPSVIRLEEAAGCILYVVMLVNILCTSIYALFV